MNKVLNIIEANGVEYGEMFRELVKLHMSNGYDKTRAKGKARQNIRYHRGYNVGTKLMTGAIEDIKPSKNTAIVI